MGSGCASSEGSSALDHSVFIMKAKHNLVRVCVYMCVCVCACLCFAAFPPLTLFFLLLPYDQPQIAVCQCAHPPSPSNPSSVYSFISLFCISPDRARAFSFIHPLSLSLSPLVSLPFSFLSVVRRLCRNVSSSSPLINSLLSQSLLSFSFFFVALIPLLFLSSFLRRHIF